MVGSFLVEFHNASPSRPESQSSGRPLFLSIRWCDKMYCSMVIYKIYPFLINEVRIFYSTFDRDINILMP